jgi:hypothetical protein
MDAYSISYTTASRRGTSRIYQDLAACRISNRNYSDERIQRLIMDYSQKVSSDFYISYPDSVSTAFSLTTVIVKLLASVVSLDIALVICGWNFRIWNIF